VGPLEKSGLIRVARSPRDARVRVALLSPAGERALVAALPLWEAGHARIREVLGAKSMVAMRDQLSGVVAHAVDFGGVETRIIDESTVYIRAIRNDRLVLGMNGTMADFELGLDRDAAHTSWPAWRRRAARS
jgi:hypothetical protein